MPLYQASVRLTLMLALAAQVLAAEPAVPPGFENPALLQAVLSGQVIAQDLNETSSTLEHVSRAYFAKISPDAIVDMMTDHAQYATIFAPRVRSASHVVESTDHFRWKMVIAYKVAFFTQTLALEGLQVVTPAADAISAWNVTNTISNHTDVIQSDSETTQLFPYQGGVLVVDDLKLTLVRGGAVSQIIKSQLKQQADNFLRTFRTELHADP